MPVGGVDLSKFKFLPEAWIHEKKRTMKRSAIVLGVTMTLGVTIFAFALFKTSFATGVIVVGTFSLVIIGCAIVGGLFLGLLLRKSMFMDGCMAIDESHVWWKDLSVQKKTRLADIASAKEDELEKGLSVTLRNGKTRVFPGPVENQGELLSLVLQRARSGS